MKKEHNSMYAILILTLVLTLASSTLAETSQHGFMTSEIQPACDQNSDLKCDEKDINLYIQSLGACINEVGRMDGYALVEPNYNRLADSDHDGCDTIKDIREAFSKKTDNIIEKKYKKFEELSLSNNCNFNAKLVCNDDDIKQIIQFMLGSCEGTPGYVAGFDRDKDHCLTERDMIILFPDFYKK